jgi:hypothetical protein
MCAVLSGKRPWPDSVGVSICTGILVFLCLLLCHLHSLNKRLSHQNTLKSPCWIPGKTHHFWTETVCPLAAWFKWQVK